MSTIADYSVFTKAFLASKEVDFSKIHNNNPSPSDRRAFVVIPLKRKPSLTPREAMNLTMESLGSLGIGGLLSNKVFCNDADGKLIGNVVRIQPSERDGSIRLVAKVAVPASAENAEDTLYNTFVLVHTDHTVKQGLPIAVATISKGYSLNKHEASVSDPLDDVENANYVSFTINHLNGYTSVDFNPDAYATYDVTDALSRRVEVLEGKEGIEGLHIAFNSNTGDIILSDSKGNVIDQANLHIDANTIIAEGEEGYKYVKTDRNQDIHSAKAFMLSNFSAFGMDGGKAYNTVHASRVRYEHSPSEVCNGIRVRWPGPGQERHDEVFYVCSVAGNGSAETSPDKKYLAWGGYKITKGQEGQDDTWDALDPKFIKTASGALIEVASNTSIYSGEIVLESIKGIAPVYNHDAFVHTVGNSSLADWDECFKLMGFHDGDDIPLGTMLPTLIQDMAAGKFDPEEFIHGVGSQNKNKENVEAQRRLAKDEMVEYNSRRPALAENRQDGTIIDHTGLDVRDGSITLGCGRIGGKNGEFQKINYGIQMKDHSSDPTRNRSESLDFTVSHNTGLVKFDDNGHAVKDYADGQATNLDSSTLLSIEAGSYISGAPTCLILAKVSRKPKDISAYPDEGSIDPLEGSPVLTPVRMTAGFSVAQDYSAPNGLNLALHDDRDNIAALFNLGEQRTAPAIIEVQAIYTHPDASNETVPAQQMHTYIGFWNYAANQPECSFSCNKIEEWMTAVGLADSTTAGVELYVVIRVY